MLNRRQFYINGQWVNPVVDTDHASQELDVINPSTEESCAVISLGGQKDTDAAVAAARAAFEGWSTTPKDERIAVLERVMNGGAAENQVELAVGKAAQVRGISGDTPDEMGHPACLGPLQSQFDGRG